ncbi:hypothetical protein BS78_K020800 [Paspalum vaginatum]|uniref:Transmembrane protein n=1 Tax=Paspalum vaginatum TaxID=158149 RepID=A0A9W7XCL5_9POAL|nr:hypothetical protein BS78_K020800 [Paspalum vaginatum]
MHCLQMVRGRCGIIHFYLIGVALLYIWFGPSAPSIRIIRLNLQFTYKTTQKEENMSPPCEGKEERVDESSVKKKQPMPGRNA